MTTSTLPTLHRIADFLAHRTGYETVAAIRDVVRRAKADGLLPRKTTLPDAVASVRELLNAHIDARRAKGRRGNGRRITRPGRDSLSTPLTERAAKRSEAGVLAAYGQCDYRTCTQGHETKVKRAGVDRLMDARPDPITHIYGHHAAPASAVASTVRGERYSSRCTFGKTESVHTLYVPDLWCVRVQSRGLAVVDGMLTLDARPVAGVGPELFAAVWVEQGAGTSLKTVSGYIAREGVHTYHAPTAKGAIQGVRRKAGLQPARRKATLNLDRLQRRHGDVVVTLADSIAAGNCESGTRSWAAAVGIDGERCTLAEVIIGYRFRPLPEALAVIRRVSRNMRSRARQSVDLNEVAIRTAVAVGEAPAGMLADYAAGQR